MHANNKGADQPACPCSLISAGMEYSYLYSYLLESFFSVLSCTLYLAKFMSTCTRTYLSTVTKNPVLMSTLRVLLSTFFKTQSDRGKRLTVSQALPHLFQMPLICLFSDLKKSASSIFLQMPKSKYWHLYA